MPHILSPMEAPYPPRIEQVLSKYPSSDGYILSLFRTFANSERFLTDHGVVNFLDKDSPLPLREREIVINRTCANLNCEYEWGVHITVFAEAAGLTPDQVAATRTGGLHEHCWSEQDALLIRVVDELCNQSSLSPETKQTFQETWTKEQQLEIMGLVGNYHTISFVANVTGLENEPFGARFPDRTEAKNA